MAKIICDVCGTAYADSASTCPICGCAKKSDARPVSASDNEGGYVHVKGGRFSNNWVKKSRNEEPPKKTSNFLLGIVVIVLLLALIVVLVIFISRFINESGQIQSGGQSQSEQNKPGQTLPQTTPSTEPSEASEATEATTTPTTAPTEPTQPADTLRLNREDISLLVRGETWDLMSTSCPISKTAVTWSSDDESVCVINNGVVEAMGAGKTMVHAVYKDQKVSCIVRCNFPADPTTDPTTPTDTQSGPTISHTDVSLVKDESFQLRLKDGAGTTLQVTWKAAKEGVVSIDGNKITALTPDSRTIVSCEYEGVTYSCIVRVKK